VLLGQLGSAIGWHPVGIGIEGMMERRVSLSVALLVQDGNPRWTLVALEENRFGGGKSIMIKNVPKRNKKSNAKSTIQRSKGSAVPHSL